MFGIIQNIARDNSFILELYIAYLPFARFLERRRFFILRLLICIAGSFSFSYFSPQFIPMSHGLWPWMIHSMGWYTLVFSITVVCIFICFKCNFSQGVFSGVCAYAMQHSFYKATTIPNYYYRQIADLPLWVNYVTYWGLMLLVYGLITLTFARKLKKLSDLKVNNVRLVVISLVLVLITVVFGYVTQTYLTWNRSLSGTPVVPMISGISILTCILVLSNLIDNATNKKMERENRMIRSLWLRDRDQYKLSKQTIETLNVRFHDLKYQINALVKDENIQKEVNERIRLYSSHLKTNNETLDVVLTEKSMYCDQIGIKLACIADGSCLADINPVDIYSLFGNSIDNAIDCLKNVDDPEKKVINIILQKSGDMIYIQIENYLPNKLTIIDSLPQTTKKDSENHGFGLKSIKAIVERYKGNMAISTDNDIFSLMIIFPKISK